MKTLKHRTAIAGILLLTLGCAACQPASSKTQESTLHMQESISQETIYSCPMHPAERGKKGGHCSICGMELQETSIVSPITVHLKMPSEGIEAGQPTNLQFTITENKHVLPLEIAHEKKFHLMIANEELTYFRHIHPQEQKDGSYTIAHTFPHGGKYLVYADIKPQGKASLVEKKIIDVKGKTILAAVDNTPRSIAKTDGYSLSLVNGSDLKTTQPQALAFEISKDGKKIDARDIQPYLGANAHIAMIGKDDKNLVHIHPVENKKYPIYAETQITNPGMYTIWVEFQTDGIVHTADFKVHVTQGESMEKVHAPHKH